MQRLVSVGSRSCAISVAALAFVAMTGCGSNGDTTGTGGKGTTSAADTSSSDASTGTTTTGSTGSGGGVALTDHEVFGSGTRLRARYWDAANGAVDFIAFDDTEKGFDCQFRKHEDGTMRCLPSAATPTNVYLDSQCNTGLASAPSCATPQFVTVLSSNPTTGCTLDNSSGVSPAGDDRYTVHAIGPQHTQTYVHSTNNICIPAPPDPDNSYFEIGDEVPGSTFAAATLEAKPIGSLAEVDVLRGEDGSFIYTTVHDSQLGYACDMQVAFLSGATNYDRCAPRVIADAYETFSESGCTLPAGVIQNGKNQVPGGCQPPQVIRYQVPPANNCAEKSFIYYKVGLQVDGATVYTSQEAPSQPCIPYQNLAGNLSGFDFYKVGPQFMPGEYLPFVDVSKGTGRITTERTGLSSGEQLRETAQMFDAQANAESCTPRFFSDGKSRCFPIYRSYPSESAPTYFQDSSCSQPLLHVNYSCDNIKLGSLYPYIFTKATDKTCVDGTATDTIASVNQAIAYTGQVYMLGASGCQATVPGSYVVVGPAVSLDTFAEVPIATE